MPLITRRSSTRGLPRCIRRQMRIEAVRHRAMLEGEKGGGGITFRQELTSDVDGVSLNLWLHNHPDDAFDADVDFRRHDVVSASQPTNNPLTTESVALVEYGSRRAIHRKLSDAKPWWQLLAAFDLHFRHCVAPLSPQRREVCSLYVPFRRNTQPRR